MGLLVLAAIALAGSLPIAIYQAVGARRWTRQRRAEDAAPPVVYGTQRADSHASRPLGTAYARTTSFIG